MEMLSIFNNEKEQQFQTVLEGKKASLEYRMHEGVLVLMHTEVPEKLGGRGIASALAEYGMNYARTRHLPVKVYCPFVQTWLKRHPEQMDIVIKPKQGL
jgi:predicted GNAT family acetyltransferase